MTGNEKQFVELLRAAFGAGSIPEDVDWTSAWDLAKRHHLEVLLYDTAKELPSLPDDLRDEMALVTNHLIAREVIQNHCLEQIRSALTKAGIHFAVLKGGILKNDYPTPYARFMSDIDFYIKPEDRPAIRCSMEAIGGFFRGTESGDEQYLFENQVGIEFHGRLLFRKKASGIENYPDWSMVDEDKNRLTEEGYALNLLGHAVDDLSGGGPGIRYILDLWVYRNRHSPQPNWELVDERLRRDGIERAAHNLLDLSEYLFGEGQETPLMQEMASYVLEGGLYGVHRRSLANQMSGGRKSAFLKQVFRSRTEFENRYVWLKKYPHLLPVAWILRLSQSWRNHRVIIRRWVAGISDISLEERIAQRERLDRFGL